MSSTTLHKTLQASDLIKRNFSLPQVKLLFAEYNSVYD